MAHFAWIAQIVWIAATVGFVVAEAATAALVSIWFVAGSIAALLAANAGKSWLTQLTVFVVVSGVALVITRPLVRRFTAARATPTNADRVLDCVGRVTETVDDENGAVKVDGKVWSARSSTGLSIPEGTHVLIDSIEGVKLYVTPVSHDAPRERAVL